MIRMSHFAPASASKGPARVEAGTPGGGPLSPLPAALSIPSRTMGRSTPMPSPDRPVLEIPFPRCSVKGCIFPAAGAGGRLCLVHDLIEKEPLHFLSVQPSMLCLDRAKYGIAESEYDDWRARDRRQLAIQLDQFRNEVA